VPTGNAVVELPCRANHTALWIYCGNGVTSELDDGANFGAQYSAQFLETITLSTDKEFQQKYVAAGGHNAVFIIPADGTHSWGYFGSQLQAMKPDLVRIVGGQQPGSAEVRLRQRTRHAVDRDIAPLVVEGNHVRDRRNGGQG
jgi:Putative esterase